MQSGTFGAVLMKTPDLVADCVSAMGEAAGGGVEVTVKCRIGVDDQEAAQVLPDFLDKMRGAGVTRIAVHARKAWLQGGLSPPKENRDIPPLEYPLVHRMKADFPPDLHLSINGGITSLDEAQAHLEIMDGVMIGRAAYHQPADILLEADQRIYGAPPHAAKSAHQVAQEMIPPYVEARLAEDIRLHSITRHMLGLFAGRPPGARAWRRILSEGGATKPGAGIPLLREALAAVPETAPETVPVEADALAQIG